MPPHLYQKKKKEKMPPLLPKQKTSSKPRKTRDSSDQSMITMVIYF